MNILHSRTVFTTKVFDELIPQSHGYEKLEIPTIDTQTKIKSCDMYISFVAYTSRAYALWTHFPFDKGNR